VAQQQGILKLKPTYARRVYADGGRLFGGLPGSTYIPRDRIWVPERWIASGTEAVNYHLDRPKGRCPYTHAGLYPGTTLRDLRRAIARGSDAVLELSPAFLQRAGEGFFVPAGVVIERTAGQTFELFKCFAAPIS